MNAPADAILAQAAYERGRQDGIKQERAMWEHSKLSQEIEAGVPSQDGWIMSPDGLSRRRAAPDAAAPHVPTPSVTLRFPFGRIASQEAAPSEAMEVLAELLEVVRQKDEVERERKNEAMNSNDWMQMKIRAEAAEGKLWDRARALVSEQSPGEQAEAAYQRAKQKDNAPRTSSGQSQKGQQ